MTFLGAACSDPQVDESEQQQDDTASKLDEILEDCGCSRGSNKQPCIQAIPKDVITDYRQVF
jgi:hypothetical protein